MIELIIFSRVPTRQWNAALKTIIAHAFFQNPNQLQHIAATLGSHALVNLIAFMELVMVSDVLDQLKESLVSIMESAIQDLSAMTLDVNHKSRLDRQDVEQMKTV